MKLTQVIRDYVDLKQAMGARFHTEAVILKAFARSVGDLALTEVTAEPVHAYVAGHGPVTRFWHHKHSVLQGLYRFAIGRGSVTRSPLPATPPPLQVVCTPYSSSPEELKQLLQAVDACAPPRSQLSATTVRTLLLLWYGAALRISEALALTVADVALPAALLTIRTRKFYKTRWVPIGPRLRDTLATSAQARPHDPPLHGPEAPFFLTRTGASVTRQQAARVVRRVCAQAAVCRHDSPRSQPRLHDLRPTWAVHRLVAWYEEGADVQRLLPHLATYLGHRHIAATQCYLPRTPALLQATSLRFAPYAQLEVHHGESHAARSLGPTFPARLHGWRTQLGPQYPTQLSRRLDLLGALWGDRPAHRCRSPHRRTGGSRGDPPVPPQPGNHARLLHGHAESAFGRHPRHGPLYQCA